MSEQVMGRCPECGCPIYREEYWAGSGHAPAIYICKCAESKIQEAIESERKKIDASVESIHWQLAGLWQKVNDMVWGKQTTRKDATNIRYILEKVQSIDNQVFALKQGKLPEGE